MPTNLEPRVERVRLSEDLPPEAEPAPEFGLFLAAYRPDDAVLAHFRRALDANTVPVGTPVAALIRTPILSSPDVLTVLNTEESGPTFRIEIEHRRFTGSLFGNIVTVGLVLVSLGALEAGPYEVVVEIRALSFHDLEDPEAAGEPTVQTRRLPFHVR